MRRSPTKRATRLARLGALSLALAAGASAPALAQQDRSDKAGDRARGQGGSQSSGDEDRDRGQDRDAGKRVTDRGVVAGVTVAGETAIDFASHRAGEFEMTYLTVVGSPATGPRAGRPTPTGRATPGATATGAAVGSAGAGTTGTSSG